MAPQMKGLHQFISDLRNTNDAEEERRRINTELNNIRSHFAGPSLDSYSKKKYLCKLLYIHLSGLTEEAELGLSKAYELARSSSYSEKSLGYMGISILHSNKSRSRAEYLGQLFSETHGILMTDLAANSADTNVLALQFIAAKFNVSAAYTGHSPGEAGILTNSHVDAEKWYRLTESVYGLCVSPLAAPTVKMRALLALSAMAKTHPGSILENDTWFPRLMSLIDERDLGVVMCTLPLVTRLTGLNPRLARPVLPQISSLLFSLLVEEKCPPSYMYHDVHAPWLVARLMQLAEHVFTLAIPGQNPLNVTDLDAETVARLRQAVSKAIQNAARPVNGTSDRNARSAVLFQAVAIAPFLDASPEAIHGAIHALSSLLNTPETNTRFLVLDALIKLCLRSRQTAVFKEYFDQISELLQDRDVSVRKKTLDLLFTICDEHTYTQIMSRLLDFFPHAESMLRQDISVKIAVLAEKFATDSLWYVSTMLRLLSIGGQSSKTVGNGDGAHAGEVWERIIQIIVNNEELQKMATKYVLNLLKKPEHEPSENIIKVASFIIGEFGHTLAESEDAESHFGVANQFRILSSSYSASGIHIRPLIMNAFLKFIMRYPNEEFVPDIIDLFDAETSSLDLEIQTRAHEYLKVATLFTSGNEADIALASALVQPIPPFESKENKLIGQLGSLRMIAGPSSSSINVSKMPNSAPNGLNRASSPLSELSSNEDENPFAEFDTRTPQLSPNWYDGYHRMLQFDVGIFYEDQFVKMTYRITRDGPALQIIFTIINNAVKIAETSLTAFTVNDIHTHSQNYVVNLSKVPESRIAQKTTMELDVKVRDIFVNKDAPVISMSFRCGGSFNTLNLKIPVVLTKTLSGTNMQSIDEFKRRWIQIGEFIGLEIGEKRGLVAAAHRRNSSTLSKMLQRLGLAIIQSTPDDPHSNILVLGAGILRMLKSNSGVLVTVKSISPDSNEFDVIVRSTGVGVPAIVYDTIRELLDSKH
ncbi:hypothetical protein OXX69_001847 [Metschnikowia pulcherrima]